MSRTTQKWIASGNVVGEITLRQTGSGKSVLNFILGVERHYSNANGLHKTIDTFPITVWGEQAEHQAAALYPGKPIYLEGFWKNIQKQNQHGEITISLECIPTQIIWLDRPTAEQPIESEIILS